MISKKLKLAVIGLGYVGLPLAIEFSKNRIVIGFDNNKKRISELNHGIDSRKEFTKKQLIKNKNLIFSSNLCDLKNIDCYIIAVPTPISKNKNPNLKPLLDSTKTVGKVLTKNNLVIYESTVYPGCIEEECVPLLQKYSGLKYNKSFYCGYSPERINPGDKKHTISKIKKITSGSNSKISKIVDCLYKEIIDAGTFNVKSIKIAEAAKIIENTQRDINIALINEFSIIFNKLNIDTESVLEAAETKWNFISFRPGLVGGHCIGVDPYYLAYKSKEIGYLPKIILAGRRVNDNMSSYISQQVFKNLKIKKIPFCKAKVLIMGLTFKENCKDIRNSKVVDIYNLFIKKKIKTDIYDPIASSEDSKKEYNINLLQKPYVNYYDLIILAVAHKDFKKMGINQIKKFGKKSCIFFDLKHLFKYNQSDFRL